MLKRPSCLLDIQPVHILSHFCNFLYDKKVSETATNCMEPFRPLKECMDEYGIVMGGQDDDDFDDRDDDNQ